MLKLCAGALTLAALSLSVAFAEDRPGANGPRPQAASSAESVVDQRIGQIKAVLRLTAEQERLWPPVEAAVRAVIRKSEAYEASAGTMLQRVGARAKALAVDAAALKRVVVASQPLLRTLDPEQRREALTLARALGLGHFAAAF